MPDSTPVSLHTHKRKINTNAPSSGPGRASTEASFGNELSRGFCLGRPGRGSCVSPSCHGRRKKRREATKAAVYVVTTFNGGAAGHERAVVSGA